MANPLMHESIWFDSYKVADAERLYQEKLAQEHAGISVQAPSSLVNEIQKTRQYIKNSLDTQKGTGLAVGVGVDTTEISGRLERLEAENKDLRSLICKLENRVAAIEKKSSSGSAAAPAAAAAPPAAKPAAAKPAAVESEDDDDDDDLFGSESEDEESKAAAEKLKQERLAAYYAKKAKKPGPIAKSNIILDVKPWDDETDLKEMERLVRAIDMDGLLWGASKFVEVGYGIKKLQITCVVEDDKVGTDDLDEKITGFEDYVQSMDIVAFNKI